MAGKVSAKAGERRAAAKRLASRLSSGALKLAVSVEQCSAASGSWDSTIDEKLSQTYFRTRSALPPATVPRRRSPLLVAGVSLFTCVVGLWVVLGPAHQLFRQPATAAHRRNYVRHQDLDEGFPARDDLLPAVPKLPGEEFLQFVTFPHGGLDTVKDHVRDVWIFPSSAHGSPWRGGFLPAILIGDHAFLNVKVRSLGAVPTRLLLEFKYETSDLLRSPGGKTAMRIPADGRWHVYSLMIPRHIWQPMNYFAVSNPTGPFELAGVSVSDRAVGIMTGVESSASSE